MSSISENSLELADSLLGLIILKPKSKSIIIKILHTKGFSKNDIRLVIDKLVDNSQINILDNQLIEISKNGLKTFEEGGFVYLERAKSHKALNDKYNNILEQYEKDKLNEYQESTIKTNLSIQKHNNFQKYFLALNILLSIINLVLLLYSIKNE